MREPQSLFPPHDAMGLMTDFYELTMAAGYFSLGHNPKAVFEAFVRTLPVNRQYLIAAGLEQAIHYLTNIQFGSEQIDWLKRNEVFQNVDKGFWDYLSNFKFSGDMWAVPEGTVVFANEPLVRIEGTLLECQLLETYLLTTLNIQTLVATKSARICKAAEGRAVVDFGARRAHGPHAGLLATRASYIGGCIGTSNVYASQVLGIKAVGTQAHSWIMSFESEEQAFEDYARIFPDNAICLIDTYDTIEGAKRAAKLGKRLKAVRLDSGNLVEQSKRVRKLLDDAGLVDVKIIASSDLNEYTISEMLANGAEIDFFGVGTDMVTSKDAPALSVVYKLVEIEEKGRNKPVRKFSSDKATFGGAKQIFREVDANGKFTGDVVGLADESINGNPILKKVIDKGKLIAELPCLDDIRNYAMNQLDSLPVCLFSLRGNAYYPVKLSERLIEYNGY